MAAQLTEQQRVKCRHHLGYLQVQSAATFVLGIPAAVQTQFVIESAFDKVLPEALPELQRHLNVLDGIEQQMVGDLELLAVEKVDEIGINPDEHKKLRREYLHWRDALANLLGVPPNPYDFRFLGGGGMGINAPVTG